MSSVFFVVPIDPSNWESSSSDLKIDLDTFQQSLRAKWPDVSFEPSSPDENTLYWRFNHKGGPSTLGSLYQDQFVSFGVDAYSNDFIVWYRSFIPTRYRLFLTFSAFPENKYYELTENTIQSDIDKFISS